MKPDTEAVRRAIDHERPHQSKWLAGKLVESLGIIDTQAEEIKQEKSATLHLISVVELRGDDLVEAKREIKRLRDFLTDLHGSIADDGAAQKIAEALKSNTEAEHD